MRRILVLTAALLLILGFAWSQQTGQEIKPEPKTAPQDVKYTNDSIARLSYIEGKTFIQRASDLGYEEGALNMPVSEGDRIGTADGRAEIHFGRGNYVRLDNDTKIDVLNLPKKDDDVARLRVWSGNIYLVVGTLKKEKGIEIHTADSSFYILDKGIYRVDVRENRDTEILVFRGLVEAAGEGGSTLVKAEQKLEVAEGQFSSKPSPFRAVADDGFDRFNDSRNSEVGRPYAKKHLPDELGDFESELDQYGEWMYLAPYGYVWVPGGIESDWRPYWNGRWSWLPLTGWTWIPYEPWGWATFHYGRWHWGVGLGWYWIPTSLWGPAWVNWWWDDFYFGWAPLSWWGYPGVFLDGYYYGHYYGPYYPYGSRALTVIRRDQLRDPNVSRVSLRGDSLKSLGKMTLASDKLSLRPVGTKISVQPLQGNKVMLRKDDRQGGLEQDRRSVSTAPGGRAIRKDGPGRSEAPKGIQSSSKGRSEGSAGKSSPKVSNEGKSGKSGPSKSTGSSRGTSSSSGRKVRKGDGEPEASLSSSSSSSGLENSPRSGPSGIQSANALSIRVYPSSPAINRAKIFGDGGASRSRSFLGGLRGGPSTSFGRAPSLRSGGSSSGRSSGTRMGSSSGRSSGSRGSSSSVSRGSSGGGVRKK